MIRENTEAGTANAIRTQFHSLADSVSPRLQAEAGFAAVNRMVDLAEKTWTSGDWKQTSLLFGQAMRI